MLEMGKKSLDIKQEPKSEILTPVKESAKKDKKSKKRNLSSNSDVPLDFPPFPREDLEVDVDDQTSSRRPKGILDEIMEEETMDTDMTPTSRLEKIFKTAQKQRKGFDAPVKMNLFSMNYSQAVKAAKDPHSHLKVVKIPHHFTYPWSICGKAEQFMKETAEKWIGQYRSGLDGIPIAIGPIKLDNDIYIHGSQTVMHIDANICSVIFQPVEGELYPCTVVNKEEDYFVGTLYSSLSVIVKCKNDRALPKNIQVGNEVQFKFAGKAIKEGGICQLKGVYDASFQ